MVMSEIRYTLHFSMLSLTLQSPNRVYEPFWQILKSTLNIIFVQFIADSLFILKRKPNKWVTVKENLTGDAEVSIYYDLIIWYFLIYGL